MSHASRKWFGTIEEFKPVYLKWKKKGQSVSNLNSFLTHESDTCVATRSGKSSSSGKTPLQKMQPGNQILSFSNFYSFSLKDKAIIMGEGMLGSHPNPLIYVIGSCHSYS